MPRRPVGRLRRQNRFFGYTLLAPQILGFALFAVFPLAEVFRLSLFDVDRLSGTEEFIGVDNYERLISDPNVPTILANTGFFVGLLSVLGTVLALSLALLANQKLRGINIFRSAIFIPALVTMAAWTIVWSFLLQPMGLIDSGLASLGVSPILWLREHWLTMTVLVFIQLVKNVGINMMIFLAALQAVPAELLDSAKVDGANRWQTFRAVVVPEISPSILMVFMLLIVGSFKAFDQIYLLTRGGPGVDTTILSYAVFREGFELGDIGYSSALAVFLFFLVLILTAIVWQLRKRFVPHES